MASAAASLKVRAIVIGKFLLCPNIAVQRKVPFGFETIRSVDPYLESDTVFAVKDSLICQFQEHAQPDSAAAKLGVTGAYFTNNFDFIMTP